MTEEVYYHSKSKGEDIPVSEMSDLYVRRAFKKMIMKERKDRKSVVQGKSVDLGGRRSIKKKK